MKEAFLRHPGRWIFLLALAVRVILMLALRTHLYPDRTEVVRIAIKLAQTGQFADAFGPGTGPTAISSPLYPLLLSVVYRIFGTGAAAELGQQVLSSLIASLTAALLPTVAIAFRMGRSAGVLAGLCAALLPVNYWAETRGSFENALAALTLALICLYFALLWNRDRFSFREACAGGLLVGGSLLVAPSALPVVVLLAAAGAWLCRARLAMYARWFCVFALLSFALLLPWAIRNQMVLGSPIFTRSSLGLNLALSNNESAKPDYFDNQVLFDKYEPLTSAQVRAVEARLGELGYDQELMQQALLWIRTHPRRFVDLTLVRFALFWFPHMVRAPQTILIRFEAIAGIAGFFLLLSRPHRTKWVMAALWAGYPVIYYAIEAFPRYRYPIDWSFVLLGSFAVMSLIGAGSRRAQPQAEPASATS
jgi:hypothetical protein